ncbi:MAG: endonuclease V [Candidatus Bathyarchaeia archaeon]
MRKADAAEFSIQKAKKAQERMAERIISQDQLSGDIRLVAGVDAAYTADLAIGAAAVLDYNSLELLEVQTAICHVKFPYVPTLLSFRELPAAVACIRKLQLQPDVFLVDGHGKAHPRGCGFASHLGLALGRPTVGVAKNRLVGDLKQVGEETFLVYNGEIVGAVLSTRRGAKPVYVSVGHLVSLETAVKIVKHCLCNDRIPEPVLQAHRIASERRKTEIAKATNTL